MIKEKNGLFYVLGDKERLVFNTKEEAEKAAGILPKVEETEADEEYGDEEE